MVATVPFAWEMGRRGRHKESCEYSERETTACQEALETRWTGPTYFPKTDTASHKFIPALGTLTTAIAKSAIAWSAVKRGKTCLDQHDPALRKVRRLCLERRREKEPLKRKRLSIALHRARQVMRRKQADLRFKKAVEMGAPSRLQGPPRPTRAPILEKLRSDGTTERVEDLQGRTDIVHNHFVELVTDPLHTETPEWIWQRWPYEVLQSLPAIDSQRVREAAFAFRERTSCAEDHLVIEMLRELDDDIWETLAKCFQFRLAEPLDGG